MTTLPTPPMLARVAVCEDDEPTLDLLCDNLRADAYDTLAAECAADALRVCKYGDPDLIVLDVGLPDASGLDVLREIRSGNGGSVDPGLPVILLSSSEEPHERLRGFEAGCDDQLQKPFHYPELKVRIAAVLRRRAERPSASVIRVGELAIELARRRVLVGEREVPLANLEFELLRHLANEPTRVFTKNELLDQIWGYRSEGRTRTVDSHASRLRRKLDPEHRRFIVNCWGVGYRLVDAA